MQECFSRYPTVYNKSGGPDEEDDEHVQALNGPNSIATQSNVDTVDQIEETNKKATQSIESKQ